jgi:penicillin amidase
MQADTLSLHARTLLPLLLQHVHPSSAEAERALVLLRRWDGNAASTSAAAAIFEAWFLQLAPAMAGPELGPILTRAYERRFTSITRFVTNQLTGGGSFCAPAAAVAQRPGEHAAAGTAASAHDCDAIVTRALDAALSSLQHRLGPDMLHWRWESAHRAVFPHQGLDTVPGLHWLLSRSVPNRGDWSTVNVGAVDTEQPFEQSEVPGYRQIVDLSPANDSRYLGSVGQSGHFLSSHYDNVLQRWHDLDHVPMRTTRAAAEHGAIGVIRLKPDF